VDIYYKEQNNIITQTTACDGMCSAADEAPYHTIDLYQPDTLLAAQLQDRYTTAMVCE